MLRFVFGSVGLLSLTGTSAHAQFGFPGTGPEEEDRQLPEDVPTGVIEPIISPRETAADRLARIFNAELRRIEDKQLEIEAELEDSPKISFENFLPQAFGYHADISRSRPKWVQIDLGQIVEPDAVALFPVTVQEKGETIFGYGFPRAFRIDISNDPGFKSYETIVRNDWSDGARRWPYFVSTPGYSGRYVRVTATSLWLPGEDQRGKQAFALSEFMVLKGEQNLAMGREVTFRDKKDSGDRWAVGFINDGITAFGIPQGQEPSDTVGYLSKAESDVKNSWVQIDLEESMTVDEVRIILADYSGSIPDPTVRFPYPIKVEISTDPDMRNAELLGRISPTRISEIGNNPIIFPALDGYGRYVRLTALQSQAKPMTFSLAEVEVYSENRNVALGKSVMGSHAQKAKGLAPEYLVDGFSSRRSLVGYLEWVSNIEKRIEKFRQWNQLEEQRLILVDRTFTRGVITSMTGLIGGLVLAGAVFAHGRVRRRKDLENLRQRISSDLHDDIGSNLSSIALLAELGKTEAESPDLVAEELSEIKLTADKTIESMRDIVWLIRPGEETWKQMMTRFRETAAKLLRAHEYSFVEQGSMHDDRLPLEFKRDFFLIYKEVLNNIVRHAEATKVDILVQIVRGKLNLSISDNGKGFDKLDQDFREGNGLRNLRMRSDAIGANLKIKSTPGEGTKILLVANLPKKGRAKFFG